MKRILGFVIFAVLMSLLVISTVSAEDYRLGPGDVLTIDIWTWGGDAPVEFKELAVRPDGKIALALNITQSDDYRLAAGDVINIAVWGFPELEAKELMIRPDGKIGFPLIGEVSATDKTPAELTKTLTSALGDYVKNPQVTVNVVKFRSNAMVKEIPATGLTLDELTQSIYTSLAGSVTKPKVSINLVKYRTTRIYVLGEVNRPGMVEIEKQHNLLDAIGMAGGQTKYAQKRSVYVVHKATGKYEKIDYDKLLTKGDLSQNVILNDGDVVYLASNNLNFINDILPYITAIYDIKHF